MNLNRRWLLGGLLTVGGVGLVASAFASPRLQEDTRLLLIGDSFAAGLGPHIKSLAREEGIDYLGKGIVGSRIDQWATGTHQAWLTQTLRSYSPTLVLVSLGTNDEYGGCTDGRERWIRALVGELEESGAQVAWIGMPTLPREETCHIRQSAASAAEHYFQSDHLKIPRGPDQLHPTAAGYAGWAGSIWRWLS